MTQPATMTAAGAARDLRVALKAAFPGVAFSVTVRRSSMSNALSVSWTDGPLKAEVRSVVAPFQGTTFDARDDSRTSCGAYAVDSISLHRDVTGEEE